jgi:small subunit ribosomal protein S6
MRTYEVGIIADPELDERALTELETRVSDWIRSAGGTPQKVDRWGRRRMAYPIRKKNDGQYIFIQAELPPAGLAAIERELRIHEGLLRFQVVLLETAA